MQLLTLKVEKVIFTIVVAATLLQSRYMWVTLKGLRKTRGKKVYFVNCMEWLQIYGYLLALSYVKFQVWVVCLPVCFSVQVPPYVVTVSVGRLATACGFAAKNLMWHQRKPGIGFDPCPAGQPRCRRHFKSLPVGTSEGQLGGMLLQWHLMVGNFKSLLCLEVIFTV